MRDMFFNKRFNEKRKLNITYNVNNISAFEALDPFRRRQGMYVDSPSVKGVNNLMYEIMGNSADKHFIGGIGII